MAPPTKLTLQRLIDNSLPVTEAYFHSAVNNADKVPENNFSDTSASPTRRVNMWQCIAAPIMIFEQKGVYFYTPNSNVRFGFFRKNEPKVD